MKILIGIAIGCALGWLINDLFSSPEIKEVRVVEYKTKWKIKPEKIKELTLKQAIGHIQSPITIDHEITDNWIQIHAYDSVKESRKDIQVKCSESVGWKTYVGLGIAVVSITAVLLY